MAVNKLGKRPFLGHVPGTLHLRNYLKTKSGDLLPPAPSEVSWVTKVPGPWGMLLNDTLGDCVPAAMLHMVQQWTFFASGSQYIPTDQDALTLYEAVGGYKPGDPSTDNGCDMQVALAYWKANGIAKGHKILGWVAIDVTKPEEMFQAIQLFGNAFTGISLPVTAQGQEAWTVSAGGVYTQNGAPGSWGGHCIPKMAASPDSRTFISWGSKMKMSPNFDEDYTEEAYAVISPDWIETSGDSPSGLDKTTLLADLSLLNG